MIINKNSNRKKKLPNSIHIIKYHKMVDLNYNKIIKYLNLNF